MKKVFIGFLKKELIQSLRDPRMRVILFVMPMIQMIVFGLAISTEIKGIKLAAIYPPQDTITEKIVERSIASGWFVPAKTSGIDPFIWIQSGQANAVLIAPPGGLTKNYNRSKGQIQFLIDATNAVRARGIENYMQSIISKIVIEKQINALPSPLQLDVRVLYNPSMESAIFMVPGVMCMILTVITVILTSMSMAREKEIGTFETLISAPIKNSQILIGKTVPFIILGMIDVPIILLVAIFVFGVPMNGPFWALLLASFMFVCTTVSIGTLISTFAKNQQQAMMGGFLFMFPSMLLSGILYPIENMPKALMWIAYLDPLKYFVTLLRNIMLKGGDFSVVWSNVSFLAIIMVCAVWLAFKRFHQTLN